MRARATMRHIRGFSLVEVMVALIVLSVGLLGVAKMQSLALSNTTVSSQRSLAAIEADSLAAAMHENRGFWTLAAAIGTINVSGNTVTGGPGAAPSSCAACTPTKLAAFDLQNWVTALNALLPNPSATITCLNTAPISCTITITWTEKAVGMNAQSSAQVGSSSAQQNPTYTLYVEP